MYWLWVWERMYSATLAAVLESRAQSISSKKYSGEGVGGLQGKGERQCGQRLLPPAQCWEGPPAAIVWPAKTGTAEASKSLPANLIHPALYARVERQGTLQAEA